MFLVRQHSLMRSTRMKLLMKPHHSDHHCCCTNPSPHQRDRIILKRVGHKEQQNNSACLACDTIAFPNFWHLVEVEPCTALCGQKHDIIIISGSFLVDWLLQKIDPFWSFCKNLTPDQDGLTKFSVLPPYDPSWIQMY